MKLKIIKQCNKSLDNFSRYLRGVAYRRQLVKGKNGPAPSVGGWRGAPVHGTASAALLHKPVGGATVRHLLPGRRDSLSLNTNTKVVSY